MDVKKLLREWNLFIRFKNHASGYITGIKEPVSIGIGIHFGELMLGIVSLHELIVNIIYILLRN